MAPEPPAVVAPPPAPPAPDIPPPDVAAAPVSALPLPEPPPAPSLPAPPATLESLGLPLGDERTIKALVVAGARTQAAALLRQKTGLPLADAMGILERLPPDLGNVRPTYGKPSETPPHPAPPLPEPPAAPAATPTLASLGLDSDVEAGILAHVKAGAKVQAITLLAEKTWMPWQEAKAVVDGLYPSVGPADRSISFGAPPRQTSTFFETTRTFTPDLHTEPAPAAPPTLASLALTPADDEAIRSHLQAGAKVQAIQLLRERTGLSWEAAKAVVDGLYPTLAPPERSTSFGAAPARPAPAPSAPPPPAGLGPLFPGLNVPPDIESVNRSLIMQGLRMPAIQMLRDHTSIGYTEAKLAVDRAALISGAPRVSPSGCYIATACYGNYDHPDVLAFRRYRDERLLPSPLGRAAVALYYAVSPALVRRFGGNKQLTRALRTRLLEPLANRLRR
jgi:hypothetical protein